MIILSFLGSLVQHTIPTIADYFELTLTKKCFHISLLQIHQGARVKEFARVKQEKKRGYKARNSS